MNEIAPHNEQVERFEAKHLGKLVVTSCSFTGIPTHQRLYEFALAYLQSAKSLCGELLASPHLLNWPRASVVYFCCHHSIELFLKAAILAKAPDGEKLHHRINKLQNRYGELFPGEQFHFHTIWDLDFDDVADLAGGTAMIADIDRKPDQVFRYFADKEGDLPEAMYGFSPLTWLEDLARIESEWAAIWPRVLAAVKA